MPGIFGCFFPKPLPLGATVPDVELKDAAGQLRSLRACLVPEGWTLVYFFPKAFTPVCTAQACHLRDHLDALREAEVFPIGISTDPPERLAAFSERFHLPFLLLSDQKKEAAQAFGVPVILGYALRQSFFFHGYTLLWRDRHPRPAHQAEDLLWALERYRCQKRSG